MWKFMLHPDCKILAAGEPFKMKCVGKTYPPSGHVQMMIMTQLTLYGYQMKLVSVIFKVTTYQEMKVD